MEKTKVYVIKEFYSGRYSFGANTYKLCGIVHSREDAEYVVDKMRKKAMSDSCFSGYSFGSNTYAYECVESITDIDKSGKDYKKFVHSKIKQLEESIEKARTEMEQVSVKSNSTIEEITKTLEYYRSLTV